TKNIKLHVPLTNKVRIKIPAAVKKAKKTFKKKPHLDVKHFNKTLHAMLKDNVTGYVMQLRKNGKLIDTLEWNWAQTPADPKIGWKPEDRQHHASVTKFLTAIGMVGRLDHKKISYHDNIINYLPEYWTQAKDID